MANQPEAATYDAGVYQVETTDAVQGGVGGIDNKALLNLANRTGYLKAHIDAIEAGTFIPPTVAPLLSPAFTGSPTAPNVTAGDNSSKIANTAFVQNLNSGIAAVAGLTNANVTLTAAQYGCGIITLAGTLTGNINVVFPVNGKWVVVNNTSGAFSITCKTAAGTGVVVAQGKSNTLAGDGTNIIQQRNDFSNIGPVLINTAVQHGSEVLRANGDIYSDGACTIVGALSTNGQGVPSAGYVASRFYQASGQLGGSAGYLQCSDPNGTYGTATYGAGNIGSTTSLAVVCGGSGGVILGNGGTSWGVFSDYRLKNVGGAFPDSGSIIDAVPVYSAAYKTSPGDAKAMFLAHEVQAVVPWAVHGEKDGKEMQVLGSSDPLVPIMWAEIRALRARIASIEAA